MGMDQYFCERIGKSRHHKLCSWRKHYRLHAWMTKKAIQKELLSPESPLDDEEISLSRDDINELENDIQSGNLPLLIGYLENMQNYDEYTIRCDLEKIQKVKAVLDDDGIIFYYACI